MIQDINIEPFNNLLYHLGVLSFLWGFFFKKPMMPSGATRVMKVILWWFICSGIVEYNHRNYGWGAICQNGFDWGEADAICRQLGWGGAYTYIHGYPYSGIYIFADMLCGGTELDLGNCPSTLRPSTTVCAGSMAAFVHCW